MLLREFLRKKRIVKGYSQEKLANILELKSRGQYISNIENGKCGVPKTIIRRYFEILKVPKKKAIRMMVDEYEDKCHKLLGGLDV